MREYESNMLFRKRNFFLKIYTAHITQTLDGDSPYRTLQFLKKYPNIYGFKFNNKFNENFRQFQWNIKKPILNNFIPTIIKLVSSIQGSVHQILPSWYIIFYLLQIRYLDARALKLHY